MKKIIEETEKAKNKRIRKTNKNTLSKWEMFIRKHSKDGIKTRKVFTIFPRLIRNKKTAVMECRWLEIAYVSDYYVYTEHESHWSLIHFWNDDNPKDAKFSIWASFHM